MALFYLLLFIIAFLYAAVGHGGASGYLALMALYDLAPEEMKPTALLLNLFVSLVSFTQYYRGRHFLPFIFLPLAAASVPMSFLGGMIQVHAGVYKKILGIVLLVPVVRFFFFPNAAASALRPANSYWSLAIGGAIGFLSGLIGIGGGIILSPVLLLLRWTDQKQTAAISALFIFVNSMAGLLGQSVKGLQFHAHMLGYVGVAFAGGLLGAYFGALRFNQQVLKMVLACVLALAAAKLILT